MFLLHSLTFPLRVNRRAKPLHLSFSSRSSCLISSHVLSFCDNIANIYSRLGLSLSFQRYAFSFMFKTIFRIVFVHSLERCPRHLFRFELLYLTMLHFRNNVISWVWPAARLTYKLHWKCMYFITYKVLYSRFPVFIIKKNISTRSSETDTVVA